MTGRFIRLAETGRPTVHFTIDGRPAQALAGDTLLVAMLGAVRSVRTSEFGDGRRAGFCLMGACQDCWVWTADGQRLRACSTPIAEGMQIVTENTEAAWLKLAS
ncbi:(2Fe-2S)-binding protein [Massilia litorea]|jgi:predicted molibdopterin-dependent oxidoreductase YjgC|uniref:(2Fe-2S)-binding protein n=1 Tax=Massilia litorea TaxID=2769491 RepID=A0A7L9UAX6_9BURK|nr:(2Fe-2S)-binding protein [Massilia litorea]QOL52221.1 (2Fe-2S)-binding protein [Massilia litorea]